MEATEPKCNPHPDAPHGFNRNASHNADRYVCDCEGWEPEQEKQEPVAVISESAIGLVKLHANGVSLPFGTPLYAAPVSAKREWVELTDDEILAIAIQYDAEEGISDVEYGNRVIAAFKEKNK